VRVIVDGEGDKKRKCQIYDCLVFEAEHDGGMYVLFGGGWFAVDKVFHALVETAFAAIVSSASFIPSTTQPNQRALIP
jgi:uncharacterized protein (TIGR04141 family)